MKGVCASVSAKESLTFALIGIVTMLVGVLVLLLSLETVERILDGTLIFLGSILILLGASVYYLGRCSESTSMERIEAELKARGWAYRSNTRVL